MHKFYEESLTTDLICNFLYEYWLPIYETVLSGDYISEGFMYIYKTNVIRCTVSGYIDGKYIQQIDPENPNQLRDAKYNTAEFVIVWDYLIGNRYRKFTDNFIATSSAYNTEIHERLGKFVTAYSDTTGIDLRPYYNFNSDHYVNNLYILLHKDEKTGESFYKLADARTTNKMLVVPIRFNRTYTIAIDCPGQVLMCPAFLSHGRRVVLTNPAATSSADKEQDVSDLFLEATSLFFNFSSISFNSPKYIEIKCKDTIAEKYYKYFKNLYLIVQLPEHNLSSIVILEGKYKNILNKFKNIPLKADNTIDTALSTEEYICLKMVNFNEWTLQDNWQLNKTLLSDLSLLLFNTKILVPFANRLVEYLFDNVIDYTWKLDGNIETAQDLLPNRVISEADLGIWTTRTREKLFNFVQQNLKSRHLDIAGNIDKETERLLIARANSLGKEF